VRIGTVTIAPGWVQDEDYVLVAQPCRVNGPDIPPSSDDQSQTAKFAREIPEHNGYPHVDVVPSHKVIIPPGTNNGVLIMRMHDVPGFRVECADPTRGGRVSGIVKESLPEGLWRQLQSLPWTPENPLTPRNFSITMHTPQRNTRGPRLILNPPKLSEGGVLPFGLVSSCSR
jgi:hypothetical protein